VEEAWKALRDVAGIYEERQADARNSAFWVSYKFDKSVKMWYNITWVRVILPSPFKSNKC
jgi:hypothetical protein